MFPSVKAIKSTAKYSLSKVWPKAVAVAFILFGAMVFPTLLYQFLDVITASYIARYETVYTGINGIYTFFVLAPLVFGVLRWFWGVTAQEDMPLSVLFSGFASAKEYGTALKVAWAFAWRIALAGIPMYIANAISLMELPLPDGIDITPILAMVAFGCGGVSFIITVFIVARLLPLPFSVINHPCQYVSDNVKESFIISKSTATHYFTLFVSLGGWLLLSLLFIPLLYTIPLFLACYAVLIRFSINHCVYK